MLYYARSDTHYLLYIYDHVRNDLVSATDPTKPDTDYIRRALQRSRELSLSRHEHPGYDEATGEGSRGWYNYVFKHSHLAFDSEQFAVFKALWKWRDDTARKEDESPNYVMSTNTITDIARFNPPDAKALHSLLPLSASLARPRSSEIWDQVREAKAKHGPSLLHFFTSMAPDALAKNGLPRAAKQTSKLPQIDEEATVSRLTRSQLFGNMPISTRWEETKRTDEPDDRIPFPWQRFVQEAATGGDIQLDTTEERMEQQSLEVEAPQAVAEPAEDPDQEFTLKRGQKRKSAPAEEDEEEPTSSEDDGSDPESDEDMQDGNGVISVVEEPEKKKSKKQRKQERREQAKQENEELLMRQETKRARKARQKEKKQKQAEEQGKKYDAVPFDYSKASSVLHAARSQGDAEDKGKKKFFDPYAKTGDDAMKGARKAPPVRGERSATFRK